MSGKMSFERAQYLKRLVEEHKGEYLFAVTFVEDYIDKSEYDRHPITLEPLDTE